MMKVWNDSFEILARFCLFFFLMIPSTNFLNFCFDCREGFVEVPRGSGVGSAWGSVGLG